MQTSPTLCSWLLLVCLRCVLCSQLVLAFQFVLGETLPAVSYITTLDKCILLACISLVSCDRSHFVADVFIFLSALQSVAAFLIIRDIGAKQRISFVVVCSLLCRRARHRVRHSLSPVRLVVCVGYVCCVFVVSNSVLSAYLCSGFFCGYVLAAFIIIKHAQWTANKHLTAVAHEMKTQLEKVLVKSLSVC